MQTPLGRCARLAGLLALIPILTSCVAGGRRTGPSPATARPARRASPSAPALRTVIRPTLTVRRLENRSGFSGTWPLEDGLAELMAARLVGSDEVMVIDRRDPPGMITGLARQARSLLRPDGRPAREAPVEARYELRGTLTEFNAGNDASGWFRILETGTRRRRQESRVAVQFLLVDTETSQILASVPVHGRVSERGTRAPVAYQDLPFAGEAYFRTPLGRATEQALAEAATMILAALPSVLWEPRVAEGGRDTAMINGGANVGVSEGMEFIIRAAGHPVTDPQTGVRIDVRHGPVKGRLRVIDVRPMAATAQVIEGEAGRGDFLVPVIP